MMIDLAAQDWLRDARLKRLFDVIAQVGGEARVAGGAVRNALWGLPVRDIDVATTLVPDQVVSVVRDAGFSVYPTGIKFGTVTVVIDDLSIEVTTLRADMETDGRHAVVQFSTDWAVDAARRDFTFNALYCDLAGQVFDETGMGLKDHDERRVRFVGEAEARIREDYLRILRFFRFEAQYGNGSFDRQGLMACEGLKQGLHKLSGERVQAELFKILLAPRVVPVIEMMINHGVLQELFEVDGSPETLARLVVIENEPDALRRLAVLTPDVSHLRLSRAQQRRFAALKTPIGLSPDSELQDRQAMLYGVGERAYRDGVMMARIRCSDDTRWQELQDLPDHWSVPEFPVSGQDLLDAGFVPGKAVGKRLKQLEQRWVSGGFSASKEVLLAEMAEVEK